jgi:predicted alpha/beta superfamily hydrolase
MQYMGFRILLLTTGLTTCGFLYASSPSTGGATTNSAEVSIPNTRRVEFVSSVNGHRYALFIALPFEPAPAKGYGVLYVLDGNSSFPIATEAVRGSDTASKVVVVGIGYPEDTTYALSVLSRRGPIPTYMAGLPPAQSARGVERTYDLTLPSSDKILAFQSIGIPPKSENVGGLDDFLQIIESEVKPRVASIVSIDKADEAFFGHSLGGLAVLHALFIEPNAFRTFLVSSPSIWWNDKAVLADEAGFAAVVSSGKASPRVLVTIGGEESTPPKKVPASWGVDLAAFKRNVEMARPVENGRELVAYLKAIHGRSDYVVQDYVVFEAVRHSQAALPALARGIEFAFDDAGQQ